MKYLIISDIHGNLEALEAVLKTTEFDQIVCLGDFVGYGPNPDEVIEVLSSYENLISVIGNHDNAVIDTSFSLINYRPIAKLIIKHQRNSILKKSKNFLKNLHFKEIKNNLFFVHGNPISGRHYDYINSPIQAIEATNFLLKNNFLNCFIGHTHRVNIWSGFNLPNLINTSVKLVNVGSVGFPRDENNNSSFVIYNDEFNSINFHRIEYNIDKTIFKMRKFAKILNINDGLIYNELIDRLIFGV